MAATQRTTILYEEVEVADGTGELGPTPIDPGSSSKLAIFVRNDGANDADLTPLAWSNTGIGPVTAGTLQTVAAGAIHYFEFAAFVPASVGFTTDCTGGTTLTIEIDGVST